MPALVLLRAVVGSLWGMAAMLRASGRTLKAQNTLLSLLLRLLAFRPDRDLRGLTVGGHFAQTRAKHAHALRNAALGVMACCEMTPEQALRYADLEEVEQEAAAKKLQGLRRSQLHRRRAAEQALREAEEKRRLELEGPPPPEPSPPPTPPMEARRRRKSQDAGNASALAAAEEAGASAGAPRR